MDLEEVRRKLYTRVQCLDADNVLKIMGYLLLQEWGEHEMLRLALGSDIVLHSLITKARKELGITSPVGKPTHSPTSVELLSPTARPFTSSENSQLRMNFSQKSKSAFEGASMAASPKSPIDHNSLYDHIASQERLLLNETLSSNSLYLSKPCHYFARGYCKHGSSCRFMHESTQKKLGLSKDLNQNKEAEDKIENDSLKALEKELRELLRGRSPVSIASLIQLYYEKYGKLLQADGCFSDSPATGKSVHQSVIKLLVQMPNTVMIVKWPHGQYAVMLTDEAPRFMAYTGGSLDAADAFNSSSRQIYLTFPAECTFTEENASDYFKGFGPVQDVRIPNQQKRMFGFVTFAYAETVRKVLSEGNPHYISGERVLVKPYKDKARLAERKHLERLELLRYPYPRSLGRSQSYEALEVYNQVLERQVAEEELDPTTALQWKLALLHLGDIKQNNYEAKNSDFHAQLQQTSSRYEKPQLSDEFESTYEDLFDIHSTPYECVLDVLNASETTDEGNSSDCQEDGHASNHFMFLTM
ncbi:hypothetical protein O6H91_17G004700 [Diphasiastrum complanatum]|uniref:Uncharacterized protein n=1 Tax=Diphasiastrum complanatum TaxID=34168 RepID=A0ACC2B3X5_DIPCM|nr:hypothetical protein O6H91_17G004700 [Diphasiastrum complanatum]